MADAMPGLIAELARLYLPDGTALPAALPVSLAPDGGPARVMTIAFDKQAAGEATQHWSLLCLVANALQVELGLPAPAVSISGSHGYVLWLSLETPQPAATVQRFLALLGKAYFPEMPPAAEAAAVLPPCLVQATGKWAAFINPGLGASFSDDCGLEMAPPLAGQVALLENLQRISEKQLLHAMAMLEQSHGAALASEAAVPAHTTGGHALLLKDATLEDIVAHLHALDIEPTFRHLIRK